MPKLSGGLLTFLIFGITPAAAGEPETYNWINPYYACMDQEAKAALKKALQNGKTFLDVDRDLGRIGDEVFETCTERYPSHPLSGKDRETAKLIVQDVLNALMHADYEKRLKEQREKSEREAALEAPALKAQSDAAGRAYIDCLIASARSIAVISTEPAEVVTKAALAACLEKREAILEVHRRYKDTLFSKEVLDQLDSKMAGQLILEIIKARAIRPTPASPAEKRDAL